MSGKILELARSASKFAMSQSGFEEDVTIISPNGSSTAEVQGLATKHYIGFNEVGAQISSKNAHVCVYESDLVGLNYPVRDSNNEISLYRHRVNVADSTGNVKNYIVTEQYPNESLGFIVLILGSYVS